MPWSLRSVVTAGLLTLVLFGSLPLAHWLNPPDIEPLLRWREIETVVWPAPPLPRAEPEPVREARTEPLPVEIPVPDLTAHAPMEMPDIPVALPAFSGDYGLAVGSGGWALSDAVFALRDVDTLPRAIVQTPPLYPYSARQSGTEGHVVLSLVVTEEGAVTNIEVVESHPGTLFVQGAKDAAARWRFEPARRGGEPVAVRVEVPLEFKLDR